MSRDLWYTVAHEEFPSLTLHEIWDLKHQAATDYCFCNSSRLGQLYEQYVILRTLSNPVKNNQ